MINNLAIVIPAYREKYFEASLNSIALQTVKGFTLYIGDDSATVWLAGIVDKYRDQINIVYKKFENNLGGKDLVAQWERCIDLVQNEEWIWLFSDDDIISEDCVEAFYETLYKYDKATAGNKVFKFNLSITDADLNCWKRCITPLEFSIDYFLQSYFIEHTLTNRAVEYIYSKKTYKEKGGYVNFPLGWGSDTATMLKFGQDSGYITIEKGEVYWRNSGQNITSLSNPVINKQKAHVLDQFHKWTYYFVQNYKDRPYYNKLVFNILRSFLSISELADLKLEKDIQYFNVVFNILYLRISRRLTYRKIKRLIIKILSS